MGEVSSTNKVVRYSPSLGCDPELFFSKGGEIVGSERVVPEKGLTTSGGGKIVQDGVQVELNPAASQCRESLSGNLREQFRHLRGILQKTDFTVSFNSVVTVKKKEMDALSDKAKILGCAPSLNTYDAKATIKVPDGFRERSAGGHIHFGGIGTLAKGDAKTFVTLLDILLGNQCVLMDRDPKAAERRKNYGRAGEYRLPLWGLEYRTLSNFWLRNYALFSMVMGMGRLAYSTFATSKRDGWDSRWVVWDTLGTLTKNLDVEKVQRAINENDYDLAFENWKVVKEFIVTHTIEMSCCLGPSSVDDFEYFVGVVKEKGLKEWFPEDPLDHWCDNIGWRGGAETFLMKHVREKRLAAQAPPVVVAQSK